MFSSDAGDASRSVTACRRREVLGLAVCRALCSAAACDLSLHGMCCNTFGDCVCARWGAPPIVELLVAVMGSIATLETGVHCFPSDMKARRLCTSGRIQLHFQSEVHVKLDSAKVVFSIGRDRRHMSGMDFKIGPKASWHRVLGRLPLLASSVSSLLLESSYQKTSKLLSACLLSFT